MTDDNINGENENSPQPPQDESPIDDHQEDTNSGSHTTDNGTSESSDTIDTTDTEETPVNEDDKPEDNSSEDEENLDDEPSDESAADESDSESSNENSETTSPKKRFWKSPGFFVYGALILIVAVVAAYATFFSTSGNTVYGPSQYATRDNLMWEDAPTSMEEQWKVSGYTGLINTSGSIIGTLDNGFARIDSQSGERVWEYIREDARLCHAINANHNVTAVFDHGSGCTDVVNIDAATGIYLGNAQYSTKDADARLVTGGDGHIALVTESFVRVLRDDLVPAASFGDDPTLRYSTDQSVKNCSIYDAAVGPKHVAIASRCEGDTSTHVRVIDIDPDESSQGKIVVDVDTGSQLPVTLPMISLAMFSFVVAGNNPATYTWQLDKDKREISRHQINQGSYGFGYRDMAGIGYVWRIGDVIHSRRGSEDISKSVTYEGAIGMPMQVSNRVLVPTRNGATLWDPVAETEHDIEISGFSGKDFAFAGRTLASYNDGVVTGYFHIDEL